jgi:EAL domain-containing protein (putative c-di-GMP-specific phosphodiesterase class I)
MTDDLTQGELDAALREGQLELHYQPKFDNVETREALCALAEMGCDMAQGYYLSKPVPAAEIPKIVTRLDAQAAAETLPLQRSA